MNPLERVANAEGLLGQVRLGGRGLPPVETYVRLKLVILDVDGTLNDGSIALDRNGMETNYFDVRDGTGLTFLRLAGISVALISGRENPIAARWAKDMNIPARRVHLGALRKLPAYESLLTDCGVSHEETVYMADDVIDVPVLEKVGLAACPSDAYHQLPTYCHVQTHASGGHGAVRQLCEHLLLQRQDQSWEHVIRKYWGLE